MNICTIAELFSWPIWYTHVCIYAYPKQTVATAVFAARLGHWSHREHLFIVVGINVQCKALVAQKTGLHSLPTRIQLNAPHANNAHATVMPWLVARLPRAFSSSLRAHLLSAISIVDRFISDKALSESGVTRGRSRSFDRSSRQGVAGGWIRLRGDEERRLSAGWSVRVAWHANNTWKIGLTLLSWNGALYQRYQTTNKHTLHRGAPERHFRVCNLHEMPGVKSIILYFRCFLSFVIILKATTTSTFLF